MTLFSSRSCIALLCSTMSFAASAYYPNQVYVHTGYGSFSTSGQQDDSWITQLGYSYALTPGMAIEVASFLNIADTDKIKSNATSQPVNADYHGGMLALRGEVPVMNRFYAYGKFGAAYSHTTYQEWQGSNQQSETLQGVRPYLAFGVKAPLSHNLLIGLETQYIVLPQEAKLNTLTLGLHFSY
ncbi:outer membrane beta-barrel protein [Photobacterium kagoshimensis]|uniref:outer membrane beta-barrel protein n=1 Tax=Photobacterium kagoshimensis TaxID=2910242 RepID=UPI003D0CAC31